MVVGATPGRDCDAVKSIAAEAAPTGQNRTLDPVGAGFAREEKTNRT